MFVYMEKFLVAEEDPTPFDALPLLSIIIRSCLSEILALYFMVQKV